MKLGDFATVTRSYSKTDIGGYCALAGLNVSNLDYVPEPLISGLFSYLLGVKLPGSGTNYLKQQLDFSSRVGLGEELTARVEVTRIRPEKNLVDLSTTCTDSQGNEICTGRALVLVKDVGHSVKNKKEMAGAE